jgi:prepilin-type N-terminal cleavage/methylation domain-containing protein
MKAFALHLFNRKTHRTGEQGMTLVELLVAMLIGSILTYLTYNFFRTQEGNYNEIRTSSEMQQELRWAMQFLSEHVKLVGNAVPQTCGWKIIDSMNGAGDDPDSLTILGSFKSVVVTTTQNMANEAAQINCSSIDNVEVGDLAVISDGTFSEIFQITGIQGTRLLHNASLPWNDNEQLEHAYASGSTVTLLTMFTFHVSTDSTGHPNLMVSTQASSPQILAGDIDQFQVRYLLKSGTWVDDTDEPYDIREVEITLRARSPEPIRGYQDVSYGDAYKRIEIKNIIIPQNLVII